MAQKYLGDYFDIHCGGEDHIPVHHTNEIAQTRGARRHAARQLLAARLLPAAQRQPRWRSPPASSCACSRCVDRGYDPLVYRYLCLTAHYRTQMSFSWEAMDAAATGARPAAQWLLARCRSVPASAPDAASVARFTAEINDDLNVPRALAVAWDVLRGDLAPAVKRATLAALRRRAGSWAGAWVPREETVPADVRALADARAAARKDKQWAEADRLRARARGRRAGTWKTRPTGIG